ncbi:unnamed protein product [Effrenium voratum]|nr:unnamed protein product [Effrenium voratum]
MLKSGAANGSEFLELSKQVALALQKTFTGAVFITGGRPGTQEAFARSCDPSKVYTLLPPGESCGFGQPVTCGRDQEEAQIFLASVADIYVTIEGAEAVAGQARLAFSRGASVIPVICTGGASSGKHDFPGAALRKPSFASEEQWSMILTCSDQTAAAVAAVAAGYSRGSHGEASSSITRREQKRMERMAASMIAWQAPPWLAPYLKKFEPAFQVGGHVVSVVGPPVYWFYCGLYRGYKALPKDAAMCLWGCGQCFFGGTYSAFFAASEAFRATGGDQVLLSLRDLKADAAAVLDANCQQEKELGHRTTAPEKVKLVLRTVDPEHISVAVGGVWAGCMGIVMALKYKFARTVALAHSLGDNLRPLAAKVFAPSALAVIPPEYRQWVEPAINLSCKVVATGIAWKLQKIISSVQCGVAGGMLAGRSACAYLLPLLKAKGLVPGALSLEDSMVDEVLGWSLAATGIYFQLFCGEPPAKGPRLWCCCRSLCPWAWPSRKLGIFAQARCQSPKAQKEKVASSRAEKAEPEAAAGKPEAESEAKVPSDHHEARAQEEASGEEAVQDPPTLTHPADPTLAEEVAEDRSNGDRDEPVALSAEEPQEAEASREGRDAEDIPRGSQASRTSSREDAEVPPPSQARSKAARKDPSWMPTLRHLQPAAKMPLSYKQ